MISFQSKTFDRSKHLVINVKRNSIGQPVRICQVIKSILWLNRSMASLVTMRSKFTSKCKFYKNFWFFGNKNFFSGQQLVLSYKGQPSSDEATWRILIPCSDSMRYRVDEPCLKVYNQKEATLTLTTSGNYMAQVSVNGKTDHHIIRGKVMFFYKGFKF